MDIEATLVTEPHNPYDANAIAVATGGATVGYLSRNDASRYRPGLLWLEERYGGLIGLRGVIAGGGVREDGYGFLGVFLRHDPKDFGLLQRYVPDGPASGIAIDTGLSDAIATDPQDESYDLAWLDRLPADSIRALPFLRKQLTISKSPIERHYLYHHLEETLYRCRDAFPSALDEFDQCCLAHDAEMDGILSALIAKWDTVPRLQLYRQMSIRRMKQGDKEQALWWAQRGIEVYGGKAAREEWVKDLEQRAARCSAERRGSE